MPSDPESPRTGSNVIFSFYRFLELSDLPSLPADDVKFLELKGCLHVPVCAILNEFVRQYFLHVHPCLPVLDEADFWRLYSNRPGRPGKSRSISLFVFQAMMFASCAVGMILIYHTLLGVPQLMIFVLVCSLALYQGCRISGLSLRAEHVV